MLQKRRFLLYLPLLMASVPHLEASSAADEDAAQMRVAEAIRRGEQFAQIGEYSEAIKEYQQALEANRSASLRSPSLAHFRIAEIFFKQNNYMAAANEFREALNGDLRPKWTEVWSYISLGHIFDLTRQRERAIREYMQAQRTRDNTQGAMEEAAKCLKAPYERQKIVTP